MFTRVKCKTLSSNSNSPQCPICPRKHCAGDLNSTIYCGSAERSGWGYHRRQWVEMPFELEPQVHTVQFFFLMHKGEKMGSSKRLSTSSSFGLCLKPHRAVQWMSVKCPGSEMQQVLNKRLKGMRGLNLWVCLTESRSPIHSCFGKSNL